MLISAQARLFFYQRPVSMRSSFEGLSRFVEEAFPGELLSGACFIFLNRQKNHLKVLQWDYDGFVIWYKRLEQGTFSWKWSEQTRLDRRSFLMLLEGITPKRLQRRFSL
jgi:transposase